MVSGLLQVNKYSCWLEMENSGGLRTENDSGELQMESYCNGVETENNSGGLKMENVR